ncbi:phage tail protein [Clostridium tagluense]|uniref:phage tail protein n=1 Tax=Clostridium tagluense TaxID=360422 RepID=UPI001C0DC828|nr:phage tail protein [Clostridium tagluense]MBU3126737.1 phage tail protein [Clostridium tagluense]
MYKVVLMNGSTETLIHYPNADKETPHVNALPLKEGLSAIDSLSFVMYPNSPGYNLVFELTTKVKIIDIRDDIVRFSGRVLNTDEDMDDTGLFYKNITCEGALSYLGDSKQRANAFITVDVATFLTQILAIHNAKVDVSKQIQLGIVDIIGSVAHSCDFKSTLIEILAVKETLGGDIRVREELGVLYLDWLKSFSVNTVDIILGTNMKDMIKGKNITTLGTRIIPLGANNITIESVNGGIDYIEDAVASGIYGAIEKTVEYRDIIDPTVLYNTCLADLSNYTQPLLLLECNALDLSFLSGNKAEQFILGTNLHLLNPVMAIDAISKVVQMDSDLLEVYNPKLTIANFPVKLSTAVNDLRASSVQNDGVYNNVQVGKSFGLRVVRSDGKVTTTLNATDVIMVENETKKVFYLDDTGNIICNDITANNGYFEGKQQTVVDGQVLIENYKNANGGVSKIYDTSGNLNVKIGSESGTGTNTGGVISLYNDAPNEYEGTLDSYKRVAIGILKGLDCGIIQLKDHTGYTTVEITGGSTDGQGAEIRMVDSDGITSIKSNAMSVGGEPVATQSWVANYVSQHQYVPPMMPSV